MAQLIGFDRLLNWKEYFKEKELSAFVDEFIEEGYFEDKLLMLPVAKSTELLFLNQTLFERFATDANISTKSLESYEDLFAVCEKFYDWSGGQDMFQINDFYHYFLTGMASFDEEFVADGVLNLESDAFKKVWEPMAHAGIYGGLCLGDGYASDRWKTGEVISNIGSTAGILYLRDYVTYQDNTTEDIKTTIMAYPHFKNGKAYVVHRGGGLFAVKSDDERKNEAAAVFAKWITDKENSINFVTKAGYLPVKKDSFEHLFENIDNVENEKYRMLYNAVKDMSGNYTYCKVPVYDGASKMQATFEKDVKAVLNASHAEYLSRIEKGEASDSLIDELVNAALAEICSRYN